MTHRVLITCRQLQETIDGYRDVFRARGIEIDLPEIVQQLDEDQLLRIIGDYDGIIAGDDHLTARVLEAGRRLKVVSKWGVGMDAIDRGAAERLGIAVYNTPGMFGDEVADVALGYVILLARQLHRLDRAVREGAWLKVRGRTLRGSALGIVGLGMIGRAVARRAAAFGMELIGTDPVPVPDGEAPGLRQVPFDALLPAADYVVITAPLNPGTHHLFDQDAFARMKEGAFLINVGRGPIVAENALVDALESGRLAGAALDVFEEEPLPPTSRLRDFPTVIFGTHNASNTREGVLRTNEKAIHNLLRGLGLEDG